MKLTFLTAYSIHTFLIPDPRRGEKTKLAHSALARSQTFNPFSRMSFYPFTGGLCFTCIFIIAQHPYLKTHSFFMQLKNPLYSQCILHGIKYQPLCCFCAPLFVFHQNYFSQENNSVWRAAWVEKRAAVRCKVSELQLLLINVNCSAMLTSLMRAILFKHKRGAKEVLGNALSYSLQLECKLKGKSLPGLM